MRRQKNSFNVLSGTPSVYIHDVHFVQFTFFNLKRNSIDGLDLNIYIILWFKMFCGYLGTVLTNIFLFQYGLALTSITDYNTLEDLYNYTNGTYWHAEFRPNNWNFTGGYTVQNPCGDDWEGVLCNASSSTCVLSDSVCVVTSLNLTYFNLRGNLLISYGI